MESESSADKDAILIGLAVTAGLLALVVIGGFTAWRCKESPRSAGGAAAEGQLAPTMVETAAPTAPPATEDLPAATAPPAAASFPATTGTAVGSAAQA